MNLIRRRLHGPSPEHHIRTVSQSLISVRSGRVKGRPPLVPRLGMSCTAGELGEDVHTPRALLAASSGHGVMEELTTVYVFASPDGDLGFSVKASGSNLPPLAGGWERRESVPMTASALARLVPDPRTASQPDHARLPCLARAGQRDQGPAAQPGERRYARSGATGHAGLCLLQVTPTPNPAPQGGGERGRRGGGASGPGCRCRAGHRSDRRPAEIPRSQRAREICSEGIGGLSEFRDLGPGSALRAIRDDKCRARTYRLSSRNFAQRNIAGTGACAWPAAGAL